jgi:uncharacterized membrane protein YhaH (DUF805 family)
MALGYATCLRVFPGVLLAGPLLAAGWQLVRHHRIERTWRRFLTATLLTTTVLTLASLPLVGGTHAWNAFLDNLLKTRRTPFANLIGLPSVLRWRPHHGIGDLYQPQAIDPMAAWRDTLQHTDTAMRPLHALLATAALLLLARRTRNQPAWTVLALGVTVLPAVTDLLGYYYIVLMVLALLWHDHPNTAPRLLALGALTHFIVLAPLPGMPVWNDQHYTLISTATLITLTTLTLQPNPNEWAEHRQDTGRQGTVA